MNLAKLGIKLRHLGAVIALLVWVGLLAGCGDNTATTAAQTPSAGATAGAAVSSGGKAPLEIRVGHGFAADEPLWLLIADPSLAPNYGKAYTIKNTPFRANTDRFTAFQAGQIDAATGGMIAILTAQSAGLPIKVVASLAAEDASQGFSSVFMALSEAGITKPADLKGKTIGIVDYKSPTDLWAKTAVASAGLNPERDVKYVVLPFQSMGEAVRSKKIDVGVFTQPFYETEKQKGGLVEVFTSRTGVPFPEVVDCIFFSDDYLKKNTDAVKAFLADLKTVTDYYLKNGPKARQTLIDKKFVQTSPELYLNIKDWSRQADLRVNAEEAKKLQDLALKYNFLESPKPIDQLIDLSYLPK